MVTQCTHMCKSVQVVAIIYPRNRLLVSVHRLLDHKSQILCSIVATIITYPNQFLHCNSSWSIQPWPGHMYPLLSHQSFWAQVHLSLKLLNSQVCQHWVQHHLTSWNSSCEWEHDFCELLNSHNFSCHKYIKNYYLIWQDLGLICRPVSSSCLCDSIMAIRSSQGVWRGNSCSDTNTVP